ncbi:penicillin-binding protein 2, partial [Acinetobacter baumannii]
NGLNGGSAAQLAKPKYDYWVLTRNKNPIRPANHQVNGGLMTAGIKPGELPSGGETASSTPADATTTAAATSAPQAAPARPATNEIDE